MTSDFVNRLQDLSTIIFIFIVDQKARSINNLKHDVFHMFKISTDSMHFY